MVVESAGKDGWRVTDGWYVMVMESSTGTRFAMAIREQDGRIQEVKGSGRRIADEGPFRTAEGAFGWACNGWEIA